MHNAIHQDQGDQEKNARLRLCYISNPNSPHTRRWVGWFARHGHTICVLADVPVQQPWTDVPVIDLSEKFFAPLIRFPVWTMWLRRYLRDWKPDILHAHRVNSAGWLAAASGFHPRVITPWGSDVFIQPQHSRVARLLARYTLRNADLVTTNSQNMKDRIIRLGANPESIKPVQFGVEIDIFSPSPSNSQPGADLRNRLAIQDRHIVLSARAMRPIYNIGVILRSIPLVIQRFPDAVFLLINYNTDPAYKHQLDELVKELGVEAYLRWLPPTRDRLEMADLYRMSDVVVSVPSSDGTPVSVLEAMACGKPVVCSDLSSVREFIISEENGWLVPIGDSLPLAQAINNLLSQPVMAAGIGLKANQVVAEKYNYEVEMQRLESLYRELVSLDRKQGKYTLV